MQQNRPYRPKPDRTSVWHRALRRGSTGRCHPRWEATAKMECPYIAQGSRVGIDTAWRSPVGKSCSWTDRTASIIFVVAVSNRCASFKLIVNGPIHASQDLTVSKASKVKRFMRFVSAKASPWAIRFVRVSAIRRSSSTRLRSSSEGEPS